MTVTINGTTGIQNVLGSASAPAESNTTNSNTGLYFPTGTTLGLSTNGTVAVSIDASQNSTFATGATVTTSNLVLTNAAEPSTVSATAATGTINFDVLTQSVLYYTSNASANWTVNFRGNSGTSLNSFMTTNQTITVAFLVTQGSTAYYNSAVTIDGNSVTPKWQGGTAPSAGDASSIDVYTYSIIKTASATFTVLASLTKFA